MCYESNHSVDTRDIFLLLFGDLIDLCGKETQSGRFRPATIKLERTESTRTRLITLLNRVIKRDEHFRADDRPRCK